MNEKDIFLIRTKSLPSVKKIEKQNLGKMLLEDLGS